MLLGQLRKQNNKFVFEYDSHYRYCSNPIALGPDLPIKKKKHTSSSLFPSIRDFAALFDVSFATIYRIENNKTSGKDTLKKIADYYKSPNITLEKMKETGVKINDRKREFVEKFLKSKIATRDQ